MGEMGRTVVDEENSPRAAALAREDIKVYSPWSEVFKNSGCVEVFMTDLMRLTSQIMGLLLALAWKQLDGDYFRNNHVAPIHESVPRFS